MNQLAHKTNPYRTNPDNCDHRADGVSVEANAKSHFEFNFMAGPRLPPGPAFFVILGISVILWGGLICLIHVLGHFVLRVV